MLAVARKFLSASFWRHLMDDNEKNDIDMKAAAKAFSQLGASKGGEARAKKLSPEERREIARQAAAARWGNDENVPQAIHGSPDRPLRIGNVEIGCYVLEDRTRVLSQGQFLQALGRHPKANVRREGDEEQLPAILQGKSINPFITKELIAKSRPIKFRTPNGVLASGYRAELLPHVCEIYLKAREAGTLDSQQRHVAKQAEILIRGLANIGIIALVDEATGYQRSRERDELAKILEAFVAKEIQKWLKTFDLEFYELMCELRGEPLERAKKRPAYFGKLTNNLVYQRLAPGVLEKLREVNPVTETGRRKTTHHRFLTPDIGHPKLKEHLSSVMSAMKFAKHLGMKWKDFMRAIDKTHPKYQPMPLFDHLEDDE
jgi:hypothetical protein